jgi:hypothetical protein
MTVHIKPISRADNTELFKKEVYTFKNLCYKTTEAKSMSCIRMERKSLKSSDIYDLKRRIPEAVAAVTCDMLRRVWEELDYRFDICRVTRGAHIECL